MAVNNKLMKVGNGVLKIGGSSGLDVSGEVLACEISASVKEGTSRLLLNGSTLESAATYEWSLKAKFVQNLTGKGFAGYLIQNAGKTADIEYTPSTVDGAKFVGKVRLDPATVGGEVGTTPDTDVTLKFIGKPTFTAATKAGGQAVA